MSTNSEQSLINDAISFISNTSARSSVTNEMVGRVLAFLNTKCSSLATKIDDEAGCRAEDDTGLETQINNIQENALYAWHGTQAQYNALSTKDANKMYVINDSLDADETVAVYLGTQLLWAVPNMVGEFLEDSIPDDWYWYPNGVKTPIPVDSATCKFSFYWPGEIADALKLFQPDDVPINNYLGCKIKKLEKMPKVSKTGSVYYMLSPLFYAEVLPEIDCTGRASINYLMVNNNTKHIFKRFAFKNTSSVTKWEMIFNLNTNAEFRVLLGLDASSLTTTIGAPLSLIGGASLIEIKNLGKAAAGVSFDLRNSRWGDDTRIAGARQSLVNSLLYWSFDRAAAGYNAATIQLSTAAFNRLSSSEVSAITAKGYTLVTA